MKLGIDEDELAACVSCGLCLPHCPTYRVTGDELRSPRGRISAMRAVQLDDAPVDADFIASMETCVQCRGCETACPSGVPFGHLIEATRTTLAAPGGAARPPWWQRWGMKVLGHHRMLLAGSTLLAVGQRLRLVPSARLGLPERLPLRRPMLRDTPTSRSAPTTRSGELSGRSGAQIAHQKRQGVAQEVVWLHTGCVMDAWLREVHVAAQRVVESTGVAVRFPDSRGACCGALHEHAGLADDARRLAERTIHAFPGDDPILVDSAGCGAMLREYGRLLGTDEGAAFSARVVDIHTWLAQHIDQLPEPDVSVARRQVAVQDPCHLRHVQRAHEPVRTVLSRYVDVVELDDEGLCCGAGGAYSLLQPELAGKIRERKVGAIERAAAPVVASANPGCALHLVATGIDARHPIQLIEEEIGGR